MRITRDTVDEMNSILIDILDDTGSEIREAAEVWLDEDADREDRADARETLENQISTLAGQIADLQKVIG